MMFIIVYGAGSVINTALCTVISVIVCDICLGSKRQLLMFGDARPHEFADYKKIMEDYPFVEDQLDWRDEADELKRQVGEFRDDTGKMEWKE